MKTVYSQQKCHIDTKFLWFLWFTHFCRNILSSRFTHFFRRILETEKAESADWVAFRMYGQCMNRIYTTAVLWSQLLFSLDRCCAWNIHFFWLYSNLHFQSCTVLSRCYVCVCPGPGWQIHFSFTWKSNSLSVMVQCTRYIYWPRTRIPVTLWILVIVELNWFLDIDWEIL